MSNSNAYNDRETGKDETALPKPQLEVIVDGNSIFKPGMKTYFVDDYDTNDDEFTGIIKGTYCSCNTVAVKEYKVCTCNPHCTCQSNCNCYGYSSCSSNSGSGSGGTRSCGGPCACVPVH